MELRPVQGPSAEEVAASMIIRVELPALGIHTHLMFRLRGGIPQWSDYLDRIRRVAEDFSDELREELAWVDVRATDKKWDLLRDSAMEALRSWREKLAKADECIAKEARMHKHMEVMREGYWRELCALRNQLRAKEKAEQDGLAWQPDDVVQFRKKDFIMSEEVEAEIQRQVEERLLGRLRSAERLVRQHFLRVGSRCWEQAFALQEELLRVEAGLREKQSLLKRVARKLRYRGEDDMLRQLGIKARDEADPDRKRHLLLKRMRRVQLAAEEDAWGKDDAADVEDHWLAATEMHRFLAQKFTSPWGLKSQARVDLDRVLSLSDFVRVIEGFGFTGDANSAYCQLPAPVTLRKAFEGKPDPFGPFAQLACAVDDAALLAASSGSPMPSARAAAAECVVSEDEAASSDGGDPETWQEEAGYCVDRWTMTTEVFAFSADPSFALGPMVTDCGCDAEPPAETACVSVQTEVADAHAVVNQAVRRRHSIELGCLADNLFAGDGCGSVPATVFAYRGPTPSGAQLPGEVRPTALTSISLPEEDLKVNTSALSFNSLPEEEEGKTPAPVAADDTSAPQQDVRKGVASPPSMAATSSSRSTTAYISNSSERSSMPPDGGPQGQGVTAPGPQAVVQAAGLLAPPIAAPRSPLSPNAKRTCRGRLSLDVTATGSVSVMDIMRKHKIPCQEEGGVETVESAGARRAPAEYSSNDTAVADVPAPEAEERRGKGKLRKATTVTFGRRLSEGANEELAHSAPRRASMGFMRQTSWRVVPDGKEADSSMSLQPADEEAGGATASSSSAVLRITAPDGEREQLLELKRPGKSRWSTVQSTILPTVIDTEASSSSNAHRPSLASAPAEDELPQMQPRRPGKIQEAEEDGAQAAHGASRALPHRPRGAIAPGELSAQPRRQSLSLMAPGDAQGRPRPTQRTEPLEQLALEGAAPPASARVRRRSAPPLGEVAAQDDEAALSVQRMASQIRPRGPADPEGPTGDQAELGSARLAGKRGLPREFHGHHQLGLPGPVVAGGAVAVAGAVQDESMGMTASSPLVVCAMTLPSLPTDKAGGAKRSVTSTAPAPVAPRPSAGSSKALEAPMIATATCPAEAAPLSSRRAPRYLKAVGL